MAWVKPAVAVNRKHSFRVNERNIYGKLGKFGKFCKPNQNMSLSRRSLSRFSCERPPRQWHIRQNRNVFKPSNRVDVDVWKLNLAALKRRRRRRKMRRNGMPVEGMRTRVACQLQLRIEQKTWWAADGCAHQDYSNEHSQVFSHRFASHFRSNRRLHKKRLDNC